MHLSVTGKRRHGTGALSDDADWYCSGVALSHALHPGLWPRSNRGRTNSSARSNSELCSPAVQESFQRARRDAALLLVRRGREDVPRGAGAGPVVRHRDLGHRRHPDVQPARRPGRRRSGPSARRRPSTRAAKMGAKTPRERDYIEAVAAYYEDWANRPERTRQLTRAQRVRGARRPLSRPTTRRRSSTRSTSPARSRRPTRPTRPT